MNHQNLIDPSPNKSALATMLIQEIRAELECRKSEIYDEIKEYPRPIPACDAQFNYLLELRNEVAQELSVLASSTGTQDITADSVKKMESLVRSSTVLRKDAKIKLQRSLREVTE